MVHGFIGTDTAACVSACMGVGPLNRRSTRVLEDTRSASYMSPLTFQIKLDSRFITALLNVSLAAVEDLVILWFDAPKIGSDHETQQSVI